MNGAFWYILGASAGRAHHDVVSSLPPGPPPPAWAVAIAIAAPIVAAAFMAYWTRGVGMPYSQLNALEEMVNRHAFEAGNK